MKQKPALASSWSNYEDSIMVQNFKDPSKTHSRGQAFKPPAFALQPNAESIVLSPEGGPTASPLRPSRSCLNEFCVKSHRSENCTIFFTLFCAGVAFVLAFLVAVLVIVKGNRVKDFSVDLETFCANYTRGICEIPVEITNTVSANSLWVFERQMGFSQAFRELSRAYSLDQLLGQKTNSSSSCLNGFFFNTLNTNLTKRLKDAGFGGSPCGILPNTIPSNTLLYLEDVYNSNNVIDFTTKGTEPPYTNTFALAYPSPQSISVNSPLFLNWMVGL